MPLSAFSIMAQYHRPLSHDHPESSMPLPSILQDRLRLPVIGAPMVILSTPALVTAQCKARIAGSFPALSGRPALQLYELLAQITADLAAHSVQHPQATLPPLS